MRDTPAMLRELNAVEQRYRAFEADTDQSTVESGITTTAPRIPAAISDGSRAPPPPDGKPALTRNHMPMLQSARPVHGTVKETTVPAPRVPSVSIMDRLSASLRYPTPSSSTDSMQPRTRVLSPMTPTTGRPQSRGRALVGAGQDQVEVKLEAIRAPRANRVLVVGPPTQDVAHSRAYQDRSIGSAVKNLAVHDTSATHSSLDRNKSIRAVIGTAIDDLEARSGSTRETRSPGRSQSAAEDRLAVPARFRVRPHWGSQGPRTRQRAPHRGPERVLGAVHAVRAKGRG